MGEMVSSGRTLARHRRVTAVALVLSCDGDPRSAASQEALPLPEPAEQVSGPVALPVARTPAIAGAPTAPNQVAETEPCPEGTLLVPGGRFSAKQYATLQRSAPWSPDVTDVTDSRLVLADHVADFCLDRTEFTFARCHRAGQCKAKYPAPADPSREVFPIRVVDVEAASLCASEGGRLPTYEEWMWAYWGGEENRKYPWGRDKPSPERLNVCDISCAYPPLNGDAPDCETLATCKDLDRSFGDDGWEYSAPVGTYPKGAARWGQLDMEGNVDEIVAVTPTLDFFFSMQRSGWRGWLGLGFKSRWPPIEAFYWSCGSTYQSGARELRSPVCGGPWDDDGIHYPSGFRCAFAPRHSSMSP